MAHQKEIYTNNWSPTGPDTNDANINLVLASASYDSTVMPQDMEVGACVRTLTRHKKPVYSVAFSTKCKLLVSGKLGRVLNMSNVSITFLKLYDFKNKSKRKSSLKEAYHLHLLFKQAEI